MKIARTSPFILLVLLVRLVGPTTPTPAHAAPDAPKGVTERVAGISVRHPAFVTSSKLRPRVDFWKEVFTVYGKYQAILHHRDFPQAVFDVVDMSAEGESLSPVAFEVFRKRRLKAAVADVESALRRLASGQKPSTPLEQRVAKAMELVPGGTAKYAKVVKDELIRTQTGIKEKYREAIIRSGRYLPLMERIFREEYGLPIELTRLPFIESSFDYKAYSSVGAAGIWQFMRRTGQAYLTINSLIDERRDAMEATRAAARYLQQAYTKLGTWPLAITSYNHGMAGVARRVRQLGTTNIDTIVEHPTERPFGFASVNFYPELLAAIEVYDDWRRYFPNTEREPVLQLAEMKLASPMSIGHITKTLGVSVEELKDLNYAISNQVWSGKARVPRGYTLKVPKRVAYRLPRLQAGEPSSPVSAPASSSIYGGTVYKVRRGDTLSRIARNHRVTVNELRQLNSLSSDLLRVGQVLIIRPREGGSGIPTGGGETRSSSTRHTVRPGDTLWGISKRYGVPLAKLRDANPGKTKVLRPGQVLVVPR